MKGDREPYTDWGRKQLEVTSVTLAEFCRDHKEILNDIEHFIVDRLNNDPLPDIAALSHLRFWMVMVVGYYLNELMRMERTQGYSDLTN